MSQRHIFVLILIFVMACLAQPAAADNSTSMTCENHTISVKLSPEGKRTYSVLGEFCQRGSVSGQTLQVLLSGGGYGPVYWDFTYEPDTYSYVRSAVAAGTATFNLSRIGIGASDHPRGLLVDIDANAYVVHQVIEYILSAESGIDTPGAVITVGHSMGSVMAVAHAVNYPQDLDGTILTGFVHNVNPDYPAAIASSSYYAPLDPQFRRKWYGWGYMTSKPDTRGDMFYYLPNADPEVIATDEATKETLTIAEIASMTDYYTDVSLAIQVPVLIVIGDDDIVGCGGELDCRDNQSVQKLEEDFFDAAACVETSVVAETGHDLNLHYSAPNTYTIMLEWIQRRIGPAAAAPCGD